MRIQEISTIVEASFLSKFTDFEISRLNFDSRKSTGVSEELFLAIAGEKNDGHQYIPQLYQQGIRNFLVSKSIDPTAYPDSNILQVSDTLSALQKLVADHRTHFDIPVVAITGSNGKTIVKEWLSTILEHQFKLIKSPKSYNSQIGVPLSVWQLGAEHEVGVFEAGVSTKGEMNALQGIIRPTIGIFTNIGAAHAEGFTSIEEKTLEKALLFKGSKQVICRRDHELIVRSLHETTRAEVITWGIDDPEASICFTRNGTRFETLWHDLQISFDLQLSNQYDVENILHAIAASILLQVTPSHIQAALAKIKPVPMRLELKRGVNDTYLLDDTYNNDLMGLSTALDYLLQQPKKKKKTVILSDILQSGKPINELYREVNGLLEKNGIHRLIGVGPQITSASNSFSMDARFYANTDQLLRDDPAFGNEIILVKGARDYNLEKVVTYLEEKSHGTVLEVNFEALTHNLNVYRKLLNPGTRLMVMVKAFAYGVGVNEIAHLLEYHQVDYLGVAYLDEAIELRKKGVTLPIMIMNPEPSGFSLLETFDLEPEIYSLSMLKNYLESTEKPPGIHLKIETGMHRLGFEEADLPELLSLLKANPDLRVQGIFTHLSSADDAQEDDYSRFQIDRFNTVYEAISKILGYQPIKHALNSSGIARWSQYQFDMVRLGIGLYGYDSSGSLKNLRPISTLKTRISQLKQVKKGDTIGYSRKGKAKKDGTIATLAIGYADGYSRAFSNGKAYVLINGQKAHTIGNVCMDMTMVDVTGMTVAEGDEAIVFGIDPSIIDLAVWANTIPYEILTSVSQRVKRVFVSE
jgi:alanine racemase